MVQKLKEGLKKNAAVLNLYENVFGNVHAAGRMVRRELKIIRTRISVQTKHHYGDCNKDKTFFIISCDGEAMGLYSMIFYMLPFMEYAKKKKYIPVIDITKSYLPAVQDKEKTGLENAWEYYYEQPDSRYTLEEVYRSRNVIVMFDGAFRVRMPAWNAMFPTTDSELRRWNDTIRSCVRLNEDMRGRLEREKGRIFKEGRKILGVGIRAGLRAGMLRNLALYNAHPVQPTCEELLGIVADKLKEWNCDGIFLSCDDREYSDKFISYFGEICYCIDRKLKHLFKDGDLVTDASERLSELTGSTLKSRTEEYVTEVYLLSECDCLYSCIGGGSQFAYFVNGGRYEHVEVYDKGLYQGLGK